MLVLYINLPMRQQFSQLIYQLLHFCGDQLVEYYRKTFKKLLTILVNDWLPKYELYEMAGANQGPMYKEV